MHSKYVDKSLYGIFQSISLLEVLTYPVDLFLIMENVFTGILFVLFLLSVHTHTGNSWNEETGMSGAVFI